MNMKPCPFCGVALIANNNPADLYVQRYGTIYRHPLNNCYLAEDEIMPSEREAWNTRAADSITSDCRGLNMYGQCGCKDVCALRNQRPAPPSAALGSVEHGSGG